MKIKSTVHILLFCFAAAGLVACSESRTPIGTPHESGRDWIVAEKGVSAHGAAYREGKQPCAVCHEIDNFCSQCHFGPGGSKVPAGVQWSHGTTPHDAVKAYEAVCNQCHGLLRSFGSGPGSCHDCHGQAGHPTGQPWLDPASAQFHGKSNLSCSNCHDPATFCFQCHFGSGGSKVPPGVTDWDHVRYPHRIESLISQEAVCNQCHGLMKSYQGHPGYTTCSSCHGIPLPHGLPTLEQHKTSVGKDLLVCQRCHGQPGTQNFSGGVTSTANSRCSDCHSGARAHPDTWRRQAGAATSHGQASDIPASCAICHDAIVGGTGTSPLPAAPPCRTCHPSGFESTHVIPFSPPELHGPPAKADLTVCETCHATPADGGPGSNPRFTVAVGSLKQGCEDCHPARSAHATNWQGKNGDQRSHRTAGNLTVACALCHGAALQGEGAAAGPSCSTGAFTNADGAATACHSGGYRALRPFHPLAWPTSHTGVTKVGGTGSCLAECHRDVDATVNSVPGCSVCHFGAGGSKAPRTPAWTHGTVPHDFLSADGDVCNACHNITRRDRNEPAPCHDCHAGPNHPLGQPWMDRKSPSFHGSAARQDLASCAQCHGSDYRGGVAGVSCYTCHFSPDGNQAPTGPVHVSDATHTSYAASQNVCNACHDTNRTYGNPPVSCHDCHAVADHPLGQPWMDRKSATFHGKAASQDLASCAQCHGSDYKGGSSGVSCYTCHFGPQGNESPTGPAHVSSATHESYSANQNVCNACHNTNRTYGNPPTSCHDCHVGPDHPLGQPWMDRKSATFHGIAASQNLASCAPCHGSDYRGGSSGVSCYTCHFGPQGNESPTGPAHVSSATHESYSANQDVCNACHNTNRTYQNPPASCHDCHAGPDHPLGQPWMDRKSATFHGIAASQNLASCAPCHGSDYRGGSSGVSCYTCHFGPQGNESPTGPSHVSNSTHQSYSTYESVCNACHNTNRTYQNPPASCHDCHAGPDHPLGQPWMDRKSATFHGIAASQNLASCAPCHGSDYRGGSAGVSCYTCHFGPQGNESPTGPSHVAFGSHERYGASQAVCNACHNTNRTYGNPPPDCHNCHGDGG